MDVPPPARPFLVRLTDGRAWPGAEFADGFVCVHHPDEPTVCTIAVSVDALLEDRSPGDPLHGARVERQDDRPDHRKEYGP
ncbi:hypothetical protein ACFXKG_18475 [Streptomyces sp. NPDC059255]|uniref:hypothetical protein n=1 Tax=Streptomyces sp. NPDC059255 TaxID=3346793 RepID=UPI003688E49F